MSMLNDKEPNLKPEEESEENQYSFLQETIKPKSLSRQQLVKQLVRIAVYGIILGVFACLGFFALKPWAQNWFQGNAEPVTIPQDDESVEQTEEAEDQETVVQSLDADNYDEMMYSISQIAAEAEKCVVSVEPVQKEENWNAEVTGIKNGVSGVIVADNGRELLIFADSSVCVENNSWDIRFQNGKTCAAELKKQDKNSGFAVFGVKKSNISEDTWNSIGLATLGNSNMIKTGSPVIALGNMFGYANGRGYGIISSTEYTSSFYDGECSVLSTDIAVHSEGTGILFNLDSEVVGMIDTSIWSEVSEGIANAYAISDLKAVIELLANGESVPYIGIYGTTVTDKLQSEQGMPVGIYVVDVETDSPAMAAGIQCGDIICQIAEDKVTSMATYQRALQKLKKDGQIIIKGKRLGAEGYVDINFSVTVGSKE